MAYTSVKFMNSQNQIVARGSHTKFVALAWKDEKNIVDELKPAVHESQASQATRSTLPTDHRVP
jgi:acyl-coenzyme A thioesterase 13